MKYIIKAAVLDTRQLTLYKEDGETITLKQGDARIRAILDDAIQQIAKKGFAEVDIPDVITGFADFERKSGVVRFFKVAREKLGKLFNKEPAETVETSNTQQAVEEILAHAVSVTDPAFTMENVRQQGNIEDNGKTDNQANEVQTTHTIVAHVDGQLIPDMERIDTHFVRASKLGSTQGAENFLRRLAKVIEQRSHSVEDLLKFMERGDMPLADDGSIVIYKILRRRNDHYVDCHTRKVPQKVGSYVCMDISLVDRQRNNECSNGLHVARRGYIAGFGGDVCTIAKLAPEDVVTVPTYDANKIRVMGYHILAELPDDLYALLKQNKPITDLPHGSKLLGQVLAGNHTPILEEVRITGQLGEGVVVTPRNPPMIPVPVKKAKAPPAKALDNPQSEKGGDKPIDPKAVVKKVVTLSRKEQAQKLFKAYKKNPSQKNKQKLLDFKKQVKLGWDKLGIPADWADN